MESTLTVRKLATKSVVLGAVAALGVGLLSAVVSSPAQAADRTVTVSTGGPKLNVRTGPSTKNRIAYSVANKSKIRISCYVVGESLSGGPYRVKNHRIWNKIAGKTAYAWDGLVYTGTNKPVVPKCAVAAAPKPVPAASGARVVDKFVSRYSGRSWDYDGSFGAQCTDLFNFYHRDVVRGRHAVRMGGDLGAKNLWSSTDSEMKKLYTKISARSKPRKGDIAVWNGGMRNGTDGVCSWGTGCGHVAIVLREVGSSKLETFSQNPGFAKKWTFSKAHLSGYYRPKNL